MNLNPLLIFLLGMYLQQDLINHDWFWVALNSFLAMWLLIIEMTDKK